MRILPSVLPLSCSIGGSVFAFSIGLTPQLNSILNPKALYHINTCLARKLQIGHMVIETYRNACFRPRVPIYHQKTLVFALPSWQKKYQPNIQVWLASYLTNRSLSPITFSRLAPYPPPLPSYLSRLSKSSVWPWLYLVTGQAGEPCQPFLPW